MDVGVADRRRDRRLAAPAHRPHFRGRAGGRPRGPRRQGHDRHLAPGTDRHPGPAGRPRRAADHAAGARRGPAARRPGHDPRPASPRLAGRRPAPPAPRSRHRHTVPRPGHHGPHPQKDPRTREPGATPGPSSCPQAGAGRSEINYPAVDNLRRSTCGFGSDTIREWPSGGLAVLDAASGTSADLVRAVIRGWSAATPADTDAAEIIDKLSHIDLSAVVSDVAGMLAGSGRTGSAPTEWHQIPSARHLAATVWTLIPSIS